MIIDTKRIIQDTTIKFLFLENFPNVKNPRNKNKETIILAIWLWILKSEVLDNAITRDIKIRIKDIIAK